MAQDPILRTDLPLAPGAKPPPPPGRPVTDDDVNRLQEWLQHVGLPRIGREIVHQAVDAIAREIRIHPIRDWLNSLERDGNRSAERLADRLSRRRSGGQWRGERRGRPTRRRRGLPDSDRPHVPHCDGGTHFHSRVQADYLLILEGEQGVQKSLACAALAGQWFSDSLPSLSDKDSRQHLRGKWLVEVSELAAFNRAETEALKAYITRTHERYRPVWARKDVIEPRQCLFIGSTNRITYLKDETGGRRFWPVKVGLIDTAKLHSDRAQLFAQAVDAYNHGDNWWPDIGFENQYIKGQQEARFEGDPWEERIAEMIAMNDRVTVCQVATTALGFDGVSRIGTADQRRIANILHGLGWNPGRDWRGRFYAKA